jgi:hypothetical protein
MFDDPKDINRERELGYRDPGYVARGDETGWGLPVAIVAIILVIGGLFMFGRSPDVQTATNQTTPPAIERPATPPAATPAPAPAPVTPAPPATAPKQ